MKWFGAVFIGLLLFVLIGAAPKFPLVTESDSAEVKTITNTTLTEFTELPDRGQFIIADCRVVVLQPLKVIRSTHCGNEHSIGSITDSASGFDELMILLKPQIDYTP